MLSFSFPVFMFSVSHIKQIHKLQIHAYFNELFDVFVMNFGTEHTPSCLSAGVSVMCPSVT